MQAVTAPTPPLAKRRPDVPVEVLAARTLSLATLGPQRRASAARSWGFRPHGVARGAAATARLPLATDPCTRVRAHAWRQRVEAVYSRVRSWSARSGGQFSRNAPLGDRRRSARSDHRGQPRRRPSRRFPRSTALAGGDL